MLAAVRERRIIAVGTRRILTKSRCPPTIPCATLPNTVLTPHLGYVVQQTMPGFYRDSIENILAFLDGKPIRVINDPKS